MAKAIKPPNKAADPLVWFIYTTMTAEGRSKADVCKASGVDRGTLLHWWTAERDPTLDKLSAVLKALGYRLKPTPVYEEPAVDKSKRGPKPGPRKAHQNFRGKRKLLPAIS